MPEGPSIVLLREAAAPFRGRTVRGVEGDSRLDLGRMQGRRIKSVRSWGKHFLIEFSGFSLRVHLLMFGTYCIDARKDKPARLGLRFDRGELNFYTCSLQYIEGPLDAAYDWSGDVLSDAWDPAAARRKLKARPDMLVCDALLDQTVFAGVGNIIKNEVLYRIEVDPRSAVGALPARKRDALIREAREYSFDFLRWKRANELKRHWQVHTRRKCPHCGGPVVKEYLGKTDRRSFFCPTRQVLYG
jgi:endonuclease-8